MVVTISVPQPTMTLLLREAFYSSSNAEFETMLKNETVTNAEILTTLTTKLANGVSNVNALKKELSTMNAFIKSISDAQSEIDKTVAKYRIAVMQSLTPEDVAAARAFMTNVVNIPIIVPEVGVTLGFVTDIRNAMNEVSSYNVVYGYNIFDVLTDKMILKAATEEWLLKPGQILTFKDVKTKLFALRRDNIESITWPYMTAFNAGSLGAAFGYAIYNYYGQTVPPIDPQTGNCLAFCMPKNYPSVPSTYTNTTDFPGYTLDQTLLCSDANLKGGNYTDCSQFCYDACGVNPTGESVLSTVKGVTATATNVWVVAGIVVGSFVLIITVFILLNK